MMFRRRASIRVHAVAFRGVATAAPPPPPPPPQPFSFTDLAKLFQPLLGMLAGAGVVGGLVVSANLRSDNVETKLLEKMSALEGKLGEKMSGLEGKVGEQLRGLEGKVNGTLGAEMRGLEGKVNATMAGVMTGAADKAKAATLEVLKDYKVSVAGGEASKSQ